MVEHSIKLHGLGAHRPIAIGQMLEVLEPAIRDSVRLAFFISTRVKGRPNKALQDSWRPKLIDVKLNKANESRFIFKLPTFGDVAPNLYKQSELWDDAPSASETALDLFGYAVSDIAQDKKDSKRIDNEILNHIRRFNRVLKNGVDNISLHGHNLSNGHTPPPIERNLILAAQELKNKTPQSQRVKIQGTLDMIRGVDNVFEIILNSGERVRAIWLCEDTSILAELWNKTVLVEGESIFRPSGKVQVIEADAIRLSSDSDAFFSSMPKSRHVRTVAPILMNLNKGVKNSFTEIADTWPGEESIEELLKSLHELGR